jgi:hypothetical protein
MQLHHTSGRRTGITLVEMLVSVALTLMVILAIVRVFDILGTNVTESRSILELSGQLRNATNQLQTDLNRVTARTVPPLSPESAEGYLEIIEGKRSDHDIDGDNTQNTFDPYVDARLTNSVDTSYASSAEGVQVIDEEFLQRVREVLGDSDDVFMATIRSDGKPFTGQVLGQVMESPLAEVVWWIRPVAVSGAPAARSLAIHRRLLLILPELNDPARSPLSEVRLDVAGFRDFLANNDLSIRPFGARVVANSMEDLTERSNRFAHWPDNRAMTGNISSFPFPLNRGYMIPASEGRDVVLSDALAFDVRVYDPSAPLFVPTAPGLPTPPRSINAKPENPYLLSPNDPGFYDGTKLNGYAANVVWPNGIPRRGAFVDLGYNLQEGDPNSTFIQHAMQPVVPYAPFIPPEYSSHFSGPPHPRSRLMFDRSGSQFLYNAPRVYCTWNARYERDGLDQDMDGVADEGTNGLDDQQNDGNNQADGRVDDANEQETSPPYPIPLRGIEITLRVQEYSTQQVRQASVVGDFLPE